MDYHWGVAVYSGGDIWLVITSILMITVRELLIIKRAYHKESCVIDGVNMSISIGRKVSIFIEFEMASWMLALDMTNCRCLAT
jgi:hypothetical protein